MTTDAASIGATTGNHSLNGSDVIQHSEQVTDGMSEKERDLIDELRAAVTSHAVYMSPPAERITAVLEQQRQMHGAPKRSPMLSL
jgi:hypothetical protein